VATSSCFVSFVNLGNIQSISACNTQVDLLLINAFIKGSHECTLDAEKVCLILLLITSEIELERQD